jgi:hypothetical protein
VFDFVTRGASFGAGRSPPGVAVGRDRAVSKIVSTNRVDGRGMQGTCEESNQVETLDTEALSDEDEPTAAMPVACFACS